MGELTGRRGRKGASDRWALIGACTGRGREKGSYYVLSIQTPYGEGYRRGIFLKEKRRLQTKTNAARGGEDKANRGRRRGPCSMGSGGQCKQGGKEDDVAAAWRRVGEGNNSYRGR